MASNPLNDLNGFIGPAERHALITAMRGEEREGFVETLRGIVAVVAAMPHTGETDGQGDAAVAHLHYFRGSCDAWITELDKGDPRDGPEDFQSQAFGMVDLGYGPELGYISIPELLAAGMELDLHWNPVTVAEVKAVCA